MSKLYAKSENPLFVRLNVTIYEGLPKGAPPFPLFKSEEIEVLRTGVAAMAHVIDQQAIDQGFIPPVDKMVHNTRSIANAVLNTHFPDPPEQTSPLGFICGEYTDPTHGLGIMFQFEDDRLAILFDFYGCVRVLYHETASGRVSAEVAVWILKHLLGLGFLPIESSKPAMVRGWTNF